MDIHLTEETDFALKMQNKPLTSTPHIQCSPTSLYNQTNTTY